ncbi:MAG: SDR family oxidoreductase [Opitutales bacterium]|nr:SDR family oxidoreductase [Opitutales bacterium]
MKYLVTGGAGFIGSNIIERLLELGHSVVSLDNFATGKRENLAAFETNPNFESIEGDIRSFETCNQACEGIDIVLHQAALGSVPRSINDPATSNEVNITGFLNMLIAAKEQQSVRRFVYAASSSTYGDSNGLPKVEDVIGKPLSPYAVTKYVNELYADVFSKTYGVECIGLRYFNVFGPRQDPDGAYAAVIPKFISLFLKGESPTINGDGSISRDFTYIDNVVQANLLAAETQNPEAVNQVYNIAFGDSTSLNEMVEVLKQKLAQFKPEVSDIEVHHGADRMGDIKHSLASIDKAKRLLKYDPKFSFSKGVEKSVKWYFENLS